MKLDDFIAIEEKYNANRLEWKGFSFWTYNRMYLYHTFIFNSENKNNTSNRDIVTYFKEMISRIIMICRVGLGNERLREREILVLNSPRKIKIEGVYECIYTTELVENLSNYIIMEYPYNGKHYFPSADKHVRFMDALELNALLYCRLYKFSKKYSEYKRHVVSEIGEIINEINQKMDISINVNEAAEWMTNSYFMYRYEKNILLKYVTKINPKIILEVNNNSLQAMILNEIAKEKGIITVELQHGTMGKEHISYNYPSNIRVLQYPDYIFTFFNSIMSGARVPLDVSRLIETGYPYFERAIKKYPKRKIDEKIRIVFVSQHSIGKELALLAVKLSRIIDNEKYKIIYILHPKEYRIWKARYGDLPDNRIEVVGNSTKSIYEYLATANIAVGVFSTALMEGLAYDLKTFLYNIEGVGYFEDFVKEGYMTLFNNEQELFRLIEECSTLDKPQKVDFWKRDAIQNMKAEINRLIRK